MLDSKNIPKISTIVNEPWFHAKPWLILGTGESLAQYKPEYLEQFNIWAIYAAIDVPGYADVLHYQDTQVPIYDGPIPRSYRYCAIRHTKAGTYQPERAVNITYKEDFTDHGLNPDEADYPRSNSTSFAFLFLASNGVKKIHTLGIDDGSTGFCDLISPLYRAINAPFISEDQFNLENATNDHWCRTYGAEWIKLNK
jgi:hypothetical protein